MEMRAEVVINAPAADAWAVIGERFGEIGQWASAITESVMDGPPAVGRARGKRNPHATRIVARAWIRVIWASWHTGTPYDPATHGATRQPLTG